MKTVSNVCYSEKTGQCLDIYLPEREEFSVLVYFHGGGFEKGDKTADKYFFEYMAAQGLAVASANYRMYPAAKYPDFLDDAAEAVAWAFKNLGNYGKIKGIYVGGSSAGGFLSQMLCFDKTWLAKYGIRVMDVAGFIHNAGQPTCHFNVLRERGIDKRRVMIDETAPLYHVGEDEEYPPMLILVSDNDIKCRYEQTMLLISVLKRFGHTENVKFKLLNGKHCAHVYAEDQNDENAFGRCALDFIKEIDA